VWHGDDSVEIPSINLVKICVGAEAVEDLLDWQKTRRAQNAEGRPRHVTRMWPRRADALLNGGSLYWVFKGLILCRQPVVALEEVLREDGILRCGLVLDPAVVRVAPAPRRPFQGWRYLAPEDAPPDLRAGREAEPALPAELDRALAEIGVL
jgi:hypothetical protein